MNQEALSQVKQEIERLAADVKQLLAHDDKACCSNQEGGVVCDSKSGDHRHVLMYFGLAAFVAAIAGVMFARKWLPNDIHYEYFN